MEYLISGIGPGESGVGRLMRVLSLKYKEKGWTVIFKRESKSIRKILNNKKFFQAGAEIILRLSSEIIFFYKTRAIKNSNIIFMHPQTAGFKLLISLTENNNVSLYLMDSSFFCIQSYNTHPENKNECLNCIKKIEPSDSCKPFPVSLDKYKNIKYLKELQNISKKMIFLAQNNLQAEMVKLHFGRDVQVKVIGMDTNELHDDNIKNRKPSDISYDIVFHGAPIVSKGIIFLISLAERLPDFSFFIPSDEIDVKKAVDKILLKNVICRSVTWENGLKELVISAKLVINPSMWSAPIEGALVKSAKFNRNVATVMTEYGYEGEIEVIENHIRLNKNPEIASVELKNYLTQI